MRGDEVVALHPVADDPDPSPIGIGMPRAQNHAGRILRPAVRRGWLEGDGGAARGEDAFVEVGWDEALDLAARELARVKSEHGNASIYGGSYGWGSAGRFHHPQGLLHRFLNFHGGYTASVNSYSCAAMEVILPHVIGGPSDAIYSSAPHWDEIAEHTELIVAFGGLAMKNTQINSGGLARHVARGAQNAAREAGVDFVNVSPVRGDIDDHQRARWIAPRPNTDVALMMGLAHTMIAAGTHDRYFLQECCAGWDELEAYLTGASDGVRRDAAWAGAICDVEPAVIEALAGEMTARRTLVTVSWSLQRADHGEQPFWMGVALACMTGSMGKPGGGFGSGYGAIHSVGVQGERHRITALAQGQNRVTMRMPVARIADLLLEPGRVIDYNGQRLTFPDIRLVYWCGGNPFHHHQDLNRLVRAWRRPETVIVHESWWNPIARFADIVFPAATALERNDLAAGWADSWLSAMHRAVPPPAEVCTDYETLCALAERLGFGEEFSERRDGDEWVRHFYETTRADLRGKGVELPDYEEFWDAGRVEMPTPERHRALDFAALRADPAGAPLPTPSGRVEISSATIAGFGYDDCPGHPAWMEPAEWLGCALASRFPLHLISNQPRTRLHSQYDNGGYSQDSKVRGREPIRLHPDDARARGIAEGDVVRVFNDRGSCLAGAVLDANLRRSVVQLSTGAWWDPVSPGDPSALDRHGNPNVLTLDKGTSRLAQGPIAQTTLVELERFDGPLPPVEAFTPPELLARLL
ncbi:MAG: molybdopterin-dependent oxidoreductase [Actinomycetota bacterium]|nr:molybdopterin-dependent oxidoreductase [Actinomycetota bacterium]